MPTAPRGRARPLSGTRVAVTARPHGACVDPDVRDGFDRARAAVEALGGEVIDLEDAGTLDEADVAAIMLAEFAAHHAPFSAQRDRYRPMVRAQLEQSDRDVPVVAYINAQKRRALLTKKWETWFAENRVDVLLEPTVIGVAGARGRGYEAESIGGAADPLTVLTATWNLTGLPVAALPSAIGARSGLPVGVSLIAPRDHEAAIVAVALELQEELGAPTAPYIPPAVTQVPVEHRAPTRASLK
jgi:Asp-tRNA(Asn)/Glu-tRNA(Gln) amidotransferase A subunit family amidase